MKLLAATLCALLLAVAASAQIASPVLTVEKAPDPEAVAPGQTAQAVLGLAFQCPNQATVQPDDWVIAVEVSPPGGFHAEASQPDPIPGEACLTESPVHFTVELTLHVPADARPALQHPVHVVVQAVPEGDGPLSTSSNELRTGITLTVAGEPQTGNDTVEPVADAGQNTPGPALPLLALAALVAAARRRA